MFRGILSRSNVLPRRALELSQPEVAETDLQRFREAVEQLAAPIGDRGR